jgi:hypothetical protein
MRDSPVAQPVVGVVQVDGLAWEEEESAEVAGAAVGVWEELASELLM